MITVLVAEDDQQLNKIVCITLANNGYNVISATNGRQALQLFEQNKVHIVVSDIMMPLMDGFELAKTIRQQNKQVPFLFTTAKDDLQSKRQGFELGVDDYLVKPFDLAELLLRMQALLRRANINSSNKLVVGNFVMDRQEHIATYNKEEIALTAKEFDLLFKLLSSPKRTYTRAQLMEEFWDYDSSSTSRTIDVHMAKVREKTSHIDEFSIQTVHGLGYKAVLNEN